MNDKLFGKNISASDHPEEHIERSKKIYREIFNIYFNYNLSPADMINITNSFLATLCINLGVEEKNMKNILQALLTEYVQCVQNKTN